MVILTVLMVGLMWDPYFSPLPFECFEPRFAPSRSSSSLALTCGFHILCMLFLWTHTCSVLSKLFSPPIFSTSLLCLACALSYLPLLCSSIWFGLLSSPTHHNDGTYALKWPFQMCGRMVRLMNSKVDAFPNSW
jgi:hypothetical protein